MPAGDSGKDNGAHFDIGKREFNMIAHAETYHYRHYSHRTWLHDLRQSYIVPLPFYAVPSFSGTPHNDSLAQLQAGDTAAIIRCPASSRLHIRQQHCHYSRPEETSLHNQTHRKSRCV